MAGLNLNDIDLVELNEAFASQSLAVIRETGLDPTKVNVNGGANSLRSSPRLYRSQTFGANYERTENEPAENMA